MCKLSDKLKLCSCKTAQADTLKHFWVLTRPFKKESNIIGTILPPLKINEHAEKYNINILRKMLNNANCFDVEMNHEENDSLELHFTCQQNDAMYQHKGNLVYAFIYKKGKWRKANYDPFGNDLINVQEGKISRPFVDYQHKTVR